MNIEIGKHVMTVDGARAGVVKGVIFNHATRALDAVVVRQGHVFPVDRIVKQRYISHVDAEGRVHLNVPAARLLVLPRHKSAKREVTAPQQPYHVAGALTAATLTPLASWR